MTGVAMPLEASAGARVFRVSLAFFIAIAVARIPDALTILAPLHLGKLFAFPMLIATFVALPRWQLLFALRSTTGIAVAAIAVLAVLSVPLAIWPSHSAIFVLGPLGPGLVLFVVVSAGFADRATARLCTLVFVLSVAADALYVLSGHAPEKWPSRAYIGDSLDPNESAALFVLTFPFAMMLASERRVMKRALGLVIALVLGVAIVRTGSRGGAVGLLVVAVLLILQARSSRRWFYMLAVAACAAVIAFAADKSSLSRISTLLAPTSDYNYTETEGRLQIWSRGIRYMSRHPLFGVGLGNFTTAEGLLSSKANDSRARYTAPHNAFVQIGAELGVFGLIALVVAVFSAARGCRRVKRLALRDQPQNGSLAEQEANLATAAFTGLMGLVTTALFLSLAYHTLTMFALAVCVGVLVGSPYVRHQAFTSMGKRSMVVRMPRFAQRRSIIAGVPSPGRGNNA